MKEAIGGAVIGCVFAFAAVYVCALAGFFKANVELHIFTVFAIVGAVAGGTGAILARLDQMCGREKLRNRQELLSEGVEKP